MAVPGKNGYSRHYSSNVYMWEEEKCMARHLDFLFSDCTPTDTCEECPAAAPEFLRQVLESLQTSDNVSICRSAAYFAAQCLDPNAPVPVAAAEDGDGKEEESEVLFRPGTIQRAQQDWRAAEDERLEAFKTEKRRRTHYCKQQFAALADEFEFDAQHDDHHGVRKAPEFGQDNAKEERQDAVEQHEIMSEDHHRQFGAL